jgi:hypothetical protein
LMQMPDWTCSNPRKDDVEEEEEDDGAEMLVLDSVDIGNVKLPGVDVAEQAPATNH